MLSGRTTIFILGGSGTGKSILAKALSKDLGLSLFQTDTYRVKLQNKSKHNHSPICRLLDENSYMKFSQKELLEIHQEVSRLTWVEFMKDFQKLKRKEKGFIIEGDDLLPNFIKRLNKLSLPIRSVCLYEGKKEMIEENIRRRDHSFGEKSVIFKNQILHAYLNGTEIYHEAVKYHIPCVTSRPFPTLTKRVMKILNLK
ncbi:hypothetical protein M1271_02910 [Patescibacteria group bacterium]|nr:hypothetical protein [Patescibacteria group bacterium]MCL5798156.1 hypothetical protein [Patescibacteria group bacterium]